MILVTAAAGFIGFHLSKKLLDRKESVVGLDSINDYYNVTLKYAQLTTLEKYKNFAFEKIDLANLSSMQTLFQQHPNCLS